MNASVTGIIERMARVLAAQKLSINAEGEISSAAAAVDACWQDHIGEAIAVLHTMREPDSAMLAAGDMKIWNAMICAAIGEAEEARAKTA